MSDLIAVLGDIASSGKSGVHAILHNCRLEGAGVSLYGCEPIVEFLRSEAPAPEELQVVRGRQFAALFAGTARGPIALVADLYGEHIARLWYLAPTSLHARRPERVDVPFDPTFGQQTPSVGFDPVDYPELSAAHVSRVLALATGFLEYGPTTSAIPLRSAAQLSRLRPYVLRAFSDGEMAATLIVVVALRSDGQPGLVQFPIAARLPSDLSADATVVADEAECDAELARSWQPSL
jgi:hypothetical protein